MDKILRLLLALVALTLTRHGVAGAGSAQTQGGAAVQAAPAAAEIPRIKFKKYTLANGLEVILSEDHRLPLVAVDLWYHVGPANEEPGRTGFAHLFEHMMFQGSRHVRANEHIRYLEGAGSSAFNATTDFDRTNYFETLPANQLELALWLESDRMGYLLDKLDQTNLATQQAVVRNERRETLENQPFGIVEEALYHKLFPATHPYYGEVIGSHADIQAAQLEEVKSFFKLYYAPNNASLTIVGDFDESTVKQWVEKYFGRLKRGPQVPKISATTPPITAERRAVVSDQVELPRVYMGWITSPIYRAGDAEANLAAQILAGGKSGRLYKRLVYEQEIAQDVSIQLQPLLLGSIFELYVTARPGHTAAEIERVIDEELDRFRSEGPDEKELERARNTIETEIIRGLERLGGFGGVADRLNQYNHYFGNPDYLQQDLLRYRRATTATVKAFAAQQLTTQRRAVVYGLPGKPDLGADVPTPKNEPALTGQGAESINADEPWRVQPPKPAADRPLHLLVPKSFQLSNGLTVIYDERPGLPIVAANLVVSTGSDANPPDKPGLASFTVAILDQGTTTRSALQIADEAAQLGATLRTASSVDASRVTVRSLKKNFSAALALLADVALHPNFPQAEIDRQRASRLAELAQRRENPAVVADQVMVAALYGPHHPYGYPEIGTQAAIQAATREDMVAFWESNFVPDNAALIVAGSITAEELKALAEKQFGGWQGRRPPQTELGAPATTAARIVVVDKPDAPQTQLLVATIGVRRSTPDFAALEVLNAALGGLFSSRINLNLREAHGYTYGAWSAFIYRHRAPGPFWIRAGVRTDVTAPSVAEIFKEVRRIHESAPTSEELELARASRIRSLPGEFETSGGAAADYSDAFVFGLGLDYYARLPAELAAVTSAAAYAVAKTYLRPDSLVVIAVGDRAKIEPELVKLDLGLIEHRDADGNLVIEGKK